jgi:hypothetical protein
MARLLCYSLRVLQSCENCESSEEVEAGSQQQNNSRDEESSTEDDGDREAIAEPAIDVFRDARKLYPWQGRQKELLSQFRKSVEEDWNPKSQQQALLEFYESLIFQHVRGDAFKSVILHFLAVLGINEETRRLREANDFSYMLAGMVYCIRVIAAEIILPSEEREA